MLRIDLHTHTWFSADSLTSPKTLVRRARTVGLDRVAVTDHGVFKGAAQAYALDPELVIRGEEMKCACGVHVIGLFLHDHIPNGLPLAETVRRIKEQGGIVYAPHPYAYVRRASPRAESVLTVAEVVEVFNARAFVPRWNRLAAQAAERVALPVAAATDAHFPWEIGNACTEVPAFTDADSFLASMQESRLCVNGTTSPLVHVASIATEATRFAFRRRASARRLAHTAA